MARICGDGQQFLATRFVTAFRYRLRQRCVAQNMALRGFKQEQRGLIEMILRLALTVFVHFCHQRPQPVIEQARVINDDVSLAFVRLVNAENLRAHRRFHFIRHLAVDEVLHRALFPVRIKHIAVEAFVLFADGKAILRSGGELLQLFQ
ncbi:hypothetical protein D3C72_892800 [compost metagenome]